MPFFEKLFQARRMVRAGVFVLITLAGPTAQAQEDGPYPSRPITLVVPSTAGGVTDTVARLVAQQLTLSWGQPVVVENKPGASAMIGTAQVARAPKDGYTALFTFTAHVQNPSLYPDLQYDALRDFAPVVEVALSSTMLAVTPDFPADNLTDFVKLIKSKPGAYTYGSYGVATTGHIYGELLRKEAGLDMEFVAYKGGTPLATDLLAGHIKIAMIDVGTAMPHLKAGTMKPLAIIGDKRSTLLPDVPTFMESGYRGFEPYAWMGMLFPAGVPEARVQAMSKEVNQIIAQPDIRQKLVDLNLEPVGGTPQAYAQVMQDDARKWGAAIKSLGIKIQK